MPRKQDTLKKKLITAAKVVLGRGPHSRAEYKDVWNNVSRTEDSAKISVAGYTDEREFQKTGAQTRDMLQQTVGINPTDVVLEIGCGVGRVGQMLAPLCKEWIGTDVSENMLGHTRKRLSAFKNVRTVALSGYDLSPIPANSIDVVYCTVVFMHLDEWERFNYVREGLRVLKPGGRMLVDNFNLLCDEGWEFFLKNMNDYEPDNRPPNVSKSSTPQELETYFKRAGFTEIQQRTENLWLITYGTKPAR